MIMSWKNLAKVFPFHTHPMFLENAVFNLAGEFSDDYNGGSWSVIATGEFFIVVPPKGDYKVEVPSNYYSGQMNSLTYGAALTLLMFNRLLWEVSETGADTSRLCDMFYSFRSCILDDSRFDSAAILKFLD